MGEGVFFGQDKKAQAFREWLDSVGGTSEKLAEGTFNDPTLPVNTSVNARMVVINKLESTDGAVFSKSDIESVPESKRLSESQIVDHILPIISRFKTSIPINIIDSVTEELASRLGMDDNDLSNQPSGFVFDGKIYLVRSGIEDIDALHRTLFHELLHFGIRRFMPRADYVYEMKKLFDSDKTIRDFAGKWLNTKEAQDLLKRTNDPEYVSARATDEALASISSIIHSNTVNKVTVVKDSKYEVIRNIKKWIVDLARKLGFEPIARFFEPKTETVTEVNQRDSGAEDSTEGFITSMFMKLEDGADRSDKNSTWKYYDPSFRTAWHGSPHDHNKFDKSKVGTGEGNQSYGHGLYFASSKGVAEYYKNALSSNITESSVENVSRNPEYAGSNTIAGKLIQAMGKNNYLSSDDLKAIGVEPEDFGIQDYEDEVSIKSLWRYKFGASDWASADVDGGKNTLYAFHDGSSILDNGEDVFAVNSPKGKLYQVELAPSEDEYLDWDKPFREQSYEVISILEEANESGKIDITVEGSNGSRIYNDLEAQLGSDKAASDFLHSIGIRGIRYLDGSSRLTSTGEVVGVWKENGKWYSRIKVTNRGGLTFSAPTDSFTTSKPYDTEKEASDWAESSVQKANYNYVIFNDADVSITAKYAKDAKSTNVSPTSIRSALAEKFGDSGIAALEQSGMLRIVRLKDAPQSLIEEANRENASALYVNGTAWLFSDRMRAEDAPGKLLHEIGEHHGLKRVLGADGWDSVRRRLVNMAKAEGSIAYGAWNGVKAKYGEFKDMSQAQLEVNERFISEVLAAIGENKEGQETSLWREILAKVKMWLADKGLFADWLNEGDIANLVNGSLKRVIADAKTGGALVGGVKMYDITLDHFGPITDAMAANNLLIKDCA